MQKINSEVVKFDSKISQIKQSIQELLVIEKQNTSYLELKSSMHKTNNNLHQEENLCCFHVDPKLKNFLNSFALFFTCNNIVEIIFYGTVGGGCYIILTDISVRTKNPWIAIVARFGRRIASFAYPVSIILVGANVITNFVSKKPLGEKWFFLDISNLRRVQDKLVNTPIQNQHVLSLGSFCYKFFNLFYGFAALAPLLLLISHYGHNLFFSIKFFLSCLLANYCYKHYVNWILNTQQTQLYSKLEIIQKEDSFFGLFRIPAVLAEDFCLDIFQLFSFFGKQVSYVTFETISNLYDTNEMLGFDAEEIIDVHFKVVENSPFEDPASAQN